MTRWKTLSKKLLKKTDIYELYETDAITEHGGCQCFGDCSCYEDFNPEKFTYWSVKRITGNYKTMIFFTLDEAISRCAWFDDKLKKGEISLKK